MNTFDVEMWDNECDMCNFYTVRWDESNISETDKFYQKMTDSAEHTDNLNQLDSFIINKIGNNYGAIDRLFNRHEDEATGLPPKGRVHAQEGEVIHFPRFPLRLYTLKITENIVILFNGGIKTAGSNQESELNMVFQEAKMFAKQILKEIQGDMIKVDRDNGRLYNYLGGEEIII